jgi:hypothetical protein
MTVGGATKFKVIQGGKADPEPMIRPPEARLLEDEMRSAREELREKLGRTPTGEQVRQRALELSAGKYGQQAREDTPPEGGPDG